MSPGWSARTAAWRSTTSTRCSCASAVFTNDANEIRHGRARSGHQAASVWSFVALLGWLDYVAATDFMGELTRRLEGAVAGALRAA